MSHPPPETPRRRGRRRRPSRRADHHDREASIATGRRSPRPPEHPLIPDGPPTLISSSDALDALVERIRAVGRFAYDTEFIGEETYAPRICLIQIATPEELVLVDPLGGLDVDPIWALIADPEIETIVHAGLQDLEPVVRALDRPPANVFDTQIGAAFVNRPYPVGLRLIVQELFDVDLGKRLTFTRWDQRPLSAAHQEYAADDVRYLPAIESAMRAELEAMGHLPWALEECATLCPIDRHRFEPDAHFRKALGTKRLRHPAIDVLWRLVHVRDEIARLEDQPHRALLRDDVLIVLSEFPVTTREALEAVRGFPRPIAARHGELVLDALANPGRIPPEKLKRQRPPEESPADRIRVESLAALACNVASARSVAPALAVSRRNVARFYFAARDGAADPASAFGTGWRRTLLGETMLAFVRGELPLAFRWQDGRIVMEGDGEEGLKGGRVEGVRS